MPEGNGRGTTLAPHVNGLDPSRNWKDNKEESNQPSASRMCTAHQWMTPARGESRASVQSAMGIFFVRKVTSLPILNVLAAVIRRTY